jgi:hypothetical protein
VGSGKAEEILQPLSILPGKGPSFFCLMWARASASSLLSRVGSGKTEDALQPLSFLPGKIPFLFCLMKARASSSSLLSRVGSCKAEDVLQPPSILPGKSLFFLPDLDEGLLELTAVQNGTCQGRGSPLASFCRTWREFFLLLPDVGKGLLQLKTEEVLQPPSILHDKSPSFFCLIRAKASLSRVGLSRPRMSLLLLLFYPAKGIPSSALCRQGPPPAHCCPEWAMARPRMSRILLSHLARVLPSSAL